MGKRTRLPLPSGQARSTPPTAGLGELTARERKPWSCAVPGVTPRW
jgi:hypothetical protein